MKPKIHKLYGKWVVEYPQVGHAVAYFHSWLEAMDFVISGRVTQLRYF